MILIDTTPMVALCDGRDAKHRTAVKVLEALSTEELCVCDAVLTEACFHLPYLSQRRRLRALLGDLRIQPLPAAYDAEYWAAVLDWLMKYSDHDPDWADACLAVLSGRDERLKVWTFDREFRTTGRRPNGTLIPLV